MLYFKIKLAHREEESQRTQDENAFVTLTTLLPISGLGI
jgi:hypothetical protein